jgi:hypothetical protein
VDDEADVGLSMPSPNAFVAITAFTPPAMNSSCAS